ncbi:MAG: sigma-70 family RNA polymerase sigma factor [Alphaproteobacteria bacterium]|uniref:sigma-70 family RNA polymerase sigma factor n=1 Tax=Maricaulis alexandrii TaxID=2570354 RepID=UPI001109E8F4|nr:sigma-70 family RNA polymerase sigma factor [Maricaulis alexandrii]MCR9267926.1 sigma-70 family RNA polymerase sigma factor [Alphaproteobacteria bacterium]
MARPVDSDAAAAFEPLRPGLTRVAYRMLGSVADAEDIIQDAFLRWLRTDRDSVREPAAFLRRTVTRLCLDQLKSARRRRETYIGPWLPEPVFDPEPVDDVTLPLMLALERLSPLERAAFLLHDVFGQDYDEIARTLDREATACRQLAARARRHVREARPRYQLDQEQGMALADAFFQASRQGDLTALGRLLADDVSVHSDGGGKRPAALRVIAGVNAVMDLFQRLLARHGPQASQRLLSGYINGLPGFVTQEPDGELQTTALDIENGRITAIYVMRNPDKLRHLH